MKKSQNFHFRFLYAATANKSTMDLLSIYFIAWKTIALSTMTVRLTFSTLNTSLPKLKILTFLKP